jgi:hypothetical protein
MESLKRLRAKIKAKKEYNREKCRRYYYNLTEEQRENKLTKQRINDRKRRDLTRKNVFKERRRMKDQDVSTKTDTKCQPPTTNTALTVSPTETPPTTPKAKTVIPTGYSLDK